MSYHASIFAPTRAPRGLGADFDPAVQSLQSALNSDLTKLGCRSIGTDGKLGPETCGALSYVIGSGKPSSIVAAAAGTFARCKSYNYSCKAVSSPVTAPPPASVVAFEPISPASAGPSKSTLVVGGVVVLAVGVLGYAIAKKKGMIK